jgi:hypothetical protein
MARAVSASSRGARAVWSAGAFLPGFLGGALTWPGKSRARPGSRSPLRPEHRDSGAAGPRCPRCHRGGTVHLVGPERPSPRHPPAVIADHGGLDRVLLLLSRHERPPPRPPGLGAQACTSVPSTRSRTPGRRRRRTRRPGSSLAARACPLPRTRAASSGRISCTARMMVDRSTPWNTASAACGSWNRTMTKVAITRSVKDSS